jgi:lipoprotein-anchoring transpeptidase ErfK/SrfK
MTTLLDRRSVLAGIGFALGGCVATRGISPMGFYPIGYPESASAYGPILDHGHEIPALDLSKINPTLLRQLTTSPGPYQPGTIVVNVDERRLYLVRRGGVATRYAVGVGREEALNFRGSAVIGRKAEWPRWSPTEAMIRRMPIYAHYAGGLSGGIDNPLGARALYLYRGNQDTYFRLHGTNEPGTIGEKVSSGCIRLFNHDIIDLYDRVSVGAPVVVLQEARKLSSLLLPVQMILSVSPLQNQQDPPSKDCGKIENAALRRFEANLLLVSRVCIPTDLGIVSFPRLPAWNRASP